MSSLFCVRGILTKWNFLLVFMGVSTKPVAADCPFVGSVHKSRGSHFISVFAVFFREGLGGEGEERGRVDIIMTTYIMQSIVREDEMT